jgi:hypothetical protein
LPETSRTELEAKLREAHAKLQVVHQGTDAPRAATLVRFGSFEVRLIQALSLSPASSVRFWLELFDHDRQISIDSIGDRTMDDAVTAAEEFIAGAIKLNENPHTWRRPI